MTSATFRDLTAAERVFAGVCLVYPFRIFLATAAGRDLHLGLVAATLLAALFAWKVRELPDGFPHPLDVAVLAFVSLAVVDLFVLRPPRASLKGFTVETRFAFFYFAGRALALRREFADWLFGATLALALAASVVGVVEHHLGWGWLLEQVGAVPDRRFRKMGLPRLYSFAMTPASAAYLLVLAIVAAMYAFERRARTALATASLVGGWQALPLTLTRTALALALAVTGAASVRGARTRNWRFTAASTAAIAAGIVAFWLRGWDRPLASYAATGVTLIDGSSRSHLAGSVRGVGLIAAEPLGYGFGQGGHLAMASGGIYPVDDMHYLTLGVQMGLPGLFAFLAVAAVAGAEWLALARDADRARATLGAAGFAIWFVLLAGGMLHPTWNMIVPQLWFWLLSAVAVNGRGSRPA